MRNFKFLTPFFIFLTTIINIILSTNRSYVISPCDTNTFNNLKYYLITALILTHFNPDFKYIVETDSSDHTLGEILSQYNKNSKLYLIAFLSQKLAPAELNYKIYNKELLVIVRCFEQWCLEFKKSLFLIYILMNHKNLQYFITIK